MKRRCENCSHWSSTDQVWGECTLISDRRRDERKAFAQYVAAPGDVEDADFWSRWDFGCALWASLAAAIKRIWGAA